MKLGVPELHKSGPIGVQAGVFVVKGENMGSRSESPNNLLRRLYHQSLDDLNFEGLMCVVYLCLKVRGGIVFFAGLFAAQSGPMGD